MKTNIHNYKKFLLNKIKYLFQKLNLCLNTYQKNCFKLSWVLLLSEIKYFIPSLMGQRIKAFYFQKI